MRCKICGSLSFPVICKNCKTLLAPTPTIKTVEDLKVISFYPYQEIERIIKFKYEKFGDKVLKALGDLSFKAFVAQFVLDKKIGIIPIDDRIKHFSHTAVIGRSCKGKNREILYSSLQGTNQTKYAGEDLSFRKNNPKGLKLLKKIDKEVILVDDVITTGTTLLEAKKVLEESNVKVLFALTLAYGS